jgi:SAM-dependent methyltransferase
VPCVTICCHAIEKRSAELSGAATERVRWAVELLNPGRDDQLLEIGCGPGVAVGLLCERLVGGRIVAIDRSATAISRAERRNAAHVAAGKAVLRTVALERLRPGDLLGAPERFDKVFAMNVNLFWVGSAAKELDLIKRLLAPGGALYLFYGYGGPTAAGAASENISRIPSVLTGRLRERGFTVEVTRGTGTLCVIATPQSADGPARPG